MDLGMLSNKIINILRVNKFKSPIMQKVLSEYNNEDWKKYKQCTSNNLYRNKVISNDFFDMFVITWKTGAITDIHKHNKGCWYKILEGCVIENVYNPKIFPYQYTNSYIREKNNVIYIDDNLRYHSVSNTIVNKYISTLHIYEK